MKKLFKRLLMIAAFMGCLLVHHAQNAISSQAHNAGLTGQPQFTGITLNSNWSWSLTFDWIGSGPINQCEWRIGKGDRYTLINRNGESIKGIHGRNLIEALQFL